MNIRERKPREKKAHFTLKHLRTDFRSMMGEEHLNAFSLVYIHQDIFLDYDKIINIYASKYPRRMLLILLVKSKQLKSLTLEKHIKFIKLPHI